MYIPHGKDFSKPSCLWGLKNFPIARHFGNLLLGEALDTRARARGRATRWKGSMPALAREPLIRVSRSFFASVRAIRNRACPGARRFRGRSTAPTSPHRERGSARRPPYGGGGPAVPSLPSSYTAHSREFAWVNPPFTPMFTLLHKSLSRSEQSWEFCSLWAMCSICYSKLCSSFEQINLLAQML